MAYSAQDIHNALAKNVCRLCHTLLPHNITLVAQTTVHIFNIVIGCTFVLSALLSATTGVTLDGFDPGINIDSAKQSLKPNSSWL